jgi:nitrous oxide reductase
MPEQTFLVNGSCSLGDADPEWRFAIISAADRAEAVEYAKVMWTEEGFTVFFTCLNTEIPE